MRLAPALLLLTVTASGCGGSGPLYTSLGSPSETTVDGRTTEWPAALRPVPREAALSIGLRRDADALAVVIVAGDERQARRVALGGLRVWLDPAGGEDRVLGIGFPAPAPLGDRVIETSRSESPDSALRRRFQAALESVEVTRGETATGGAALTQRGRRDRSDGLETAATWERDRLVVEMRIPLAAVPGLLPAGASGPLGVGVEVVDVRETVMARRADRGRRPRRGEVPDTGEPATEVERPPAKVETTTRWLRLE